jgi:hypothetical protein
MCTIAPATPSATAFGRRSFEQCDRAGEWRTAVRGAHNAINLNGNGTNYTRNTGNILLGQRA